MPVDTTRATIYFGAGEVSSSVRCLAGQINNRAVMGDAPEQILAILSLELRNRQIARDDALPSIFMKQVYDLKEDGTAARVQIAAVHVFEEQSEHVATAADVDDLVDSYVGIIDHTIEIRPFGIAASGGIVGVLLQQVPNRHSSEREPLPRRMRSHELTEEHLSVKRGR